MSDGISMDGRTVHTPWSHVFGIGLATGVVLLASRKLGMQLTTAVAGDWRRQLEAEHRLAEGIFKLGAKTKPSQTVRRSLLLTKLRYALLKHGLQEETVIYPVMRETGAPTDAAHLAAEHFDIKAYLHQLGELPKGDARWLATWNEFHRLVSRHIAEEERSLFPRLHRAMTRKQNRSLTLAMNRQGVKLA